MRITSLVVALTSLAQLSLASSLIQATYWPAYDGVSPSTSVPWAETHIAYYFCLTTTKTGIEMPEGQTTSDLKAFVKDAHAHGNKAVLTVGGWDGGLYFSNLVSTAAKRKSLATALHTFMTKYDADGIDIDWESPNSQGIGCNTIRSSDAANLYSFFKELRAVVGSSKLITAAVGTSTFVGPSGEPLADVKKYSTYLNYINLMTYDLVGTWDSKSASASPLGNSKGNCGSDASAYSAVKAWTKAGFPADKILLGIPTYGTGFTTKSKTLSTTKTDGYSMKIRQSISTTIPKGASGDTKGGTDVCGNKNTQYSGQYTYKQLISEGLLESSGKEGKNGYKRYWDTCSQTPFLFKSSTKHFISYEDAQSAEVKARWAKKMGLAGVMTFDSTGFPTAIFKDIKTALGSSVSKRAHHEIGDH